MATHSSIFARKIPWTKEPGGLQSVHRVCKELDTTEVTEHKQKEHQVSSILRFQMQAVTQKCLALVY